MLKKEMESKIKALEERIDKLREALIWCSGSEDFQEGGKARTGWLRGCRPLLKNN